MLSRIQNRSEFTHTVGLLYVPMHNPWLPPWTFYHTVTPKPVGNEWTQNMAKTRLCMLMQPRMENSILFLLVSFCSYFMFHHMTLDDFFEHLPLLIFVEGCIYQADEEVQCVSVVCDTNNWWEELICFVYVTVWLQRLICMDYLLILIFFVAFILNCPKYEKDIVYFIIHLHLDLLFFGRTRN